MRKKIKKVKNLLCFLLDNSYNFFRGNENEFIQQRKHGLQQIQNHKYFLFCFLFWRHINSCFLGVRVSDLFFLGYANKNSKERSQAMSQRNPNLVLDVEENPKKVSQWLIFGIQHILAMLVACITVPLITGLPVAATLVSAGIGTIIYLSITKFKSPVFLSSSFAYLNPMISALSVGLISNSLSDQTNYFAVLLGMVMVGAIYAIVSLIIRFVGTKWLNKVLPTIVIGPVIMVIGLSLSGSAVSNLVTAKFAASTNYNWIAIISGLVAMVVVALCAHYGKDKFISLIPFVVGMGTGYLVAVLFTVFGYYVGGNDYFHIVNFKPLIDIFGDNFSFASIFNYKMFVPNDPESFMFLRFDQIALFDWGTIATVLLLFIPVSLVTIAEHIGDHENLGNIIGRDLLNDEPGLERTLLGDGLATAASGVLCGAANTTYGENVAVIGTTRIASVKVVLLAALMAVGFGFITPLTRLLETIPSSVTGGVSLILYGFIAASGVKMLIGQKVDFNVPKNIFVASVILVAGIGGLAFKFGVPRDLGLANPNSPIITITSVATAMILGILLNFILKDPKTDKKEETESKSENEVEL